MDDERFLPLHMNISDRNERLYNFLVSMGLVVYPIVKNGYIDYLHVQADFYLKNCPRRPPLLALVRQWIALRLERTSLPPKTTGRM